LGGEEGASAKVIREKGGEGGRADYVAAQPSEKKVNAVLMSGSLTIIYCGKKGKTGLHCEREKEKKKRTGRRRCTRLEKEQVFAISSRSGRDDVQLTEG